MTSTSSALDLPSTFRSLYGPVAIVLALLLGGLWTMGYGPGGSACRVPSVAALPDLPGAGQAATSGVTSGVTSGATSGASLAAPVAPAVVQAALVSALPLAQKLYFAPSSTQVGSDAKAKLDKIVAYLKANNDAMVVLSGFHDAKGNQAGNEELALNRARAVRMLLEEMGIPRERVEMAKPAVTTGAGDDQEARRVEVSIKG